MLIGRAAQSTLEVHLTGAALSDASVSPTNSEVGYQLSGTGLEQSFEGVGNAYVTIEKWKIRGSESDYDCKLTVNSGTAPTGSGIASWINLGSAQAWTLLDTGPLGGVISNNCTIEISRATDNTDILATATVTMEVEETV